MKWLVAFAGVLAGILVLRAAPGHAAPFAPLKDYRLLYAISRNGRPTKADYFIRFEKDGFDEIRSWCTGAEAEGLPFAPGTSEETMKHLKLGGGGVSEFSVEEKGVQRIQITVVPEKKKTEVREKDPGSRNSRLRTIIPEKVRVVSFEALLLDFPRRAVDTKEVLFWLEEGGEAKRGKRLEITPAGSEAFPGGPPGFKARRYLVENVGTTGERFLAFEVFVNAMGLPVYVTTKGREWALTLESVGSVAEGEKSVGELVEKHARGLLAAEEKYKGAVFVNGQWLVNYTRKEKPPGSDLMPLAAAMIVKKFGGDPGRLQGQGDGVRYRSADDRYVLSVPAAEACAKLRLDFPGLNPACDAVIEKRCCSLDELGGWTTHRTLLQRGGRNEPPRWPRLNQAYSRVEGQFELDTPVDEDKPRMDEQPPPASEPLLRALRNCIDQKNSGRKFEIDERQLFRTGEVAPRGDSWGRYVAPEFCFAVAIPLDEGLKRALATKAATILLDNLAPGAGHPIAGAALPGIESQQYIFAAGGGEVFEVYAAPRRLKGINCDKAERACELPGQRQVTSGNLVSWVKADVRCHGEPVVKEGKVRYHFQKDAYAREELFR